MRHRILYIMNVDWNWAKQRPHFLAQHLSYSNDMLVIYPFAWKRNNLSKNDSMGAQVYPFFRFPLSSKSSLIRRLNKLLLRMMARALLRWHRPDFVWISSPELFAYLPKLTTEKLIYDCMDDVLAFPRNSSRRKLLEESEKKLIHLSYIVFCSSNNLREKLTIRAGDDDKYVVIHNAFEPSAFSVVSNNAEQKVEKKIHVLGYVGTISSWLDFEALTKIVDQFSSLEIHLMGPVENLEINLPQHERIKYLGAVRHQDIHVHVSKFDVLMMPFKVTELIQSVDPVKLYEYVFFDKPIVSVRYKEIERFSKFVDFYSNHEDLISILDRYLRENFKRKYTAEEREQFISINTWAHRVASINEKLSQSGAK